MKAGESVIKHIQSFWSLLEQLSIVGVLVTNDDVVLSLMWSMPLSYKTFTTSMRRQPNITLQFFITYLFKKKS
jgi:hypothetical protein